MGDLCSSFNLNNKEEYDAFVDQIVHAFLRDRNENPELQNLVKLYQLHRHSRTCRKINLVSLNLESFSRKKDSCGAFAGERKRNKVRGYINNFLNP